MKNYIQNSPGHSKYIRVALFPAALILLLTILGCGSGGDGRSSGAQKLQDSGSNTYEMPAEARSVTLSWTAPARNSNGTSLQDLAGFKVYYGPSSRKYDRWIDVGPFTDAVISNLPPGILFFAVTAYDTAGNESTYSAEVCK